MLCEVPSRQSSTELSWSFGKLSLLPVLAHHPGLLPSVGLVGHARALHALGGPIRLL